MRIERISDAEAVHAAADLFDVPPLAEATRKFLDSPGHHLLLAYDSAPPAFAPSESAPPAFAPSESAPSESASAEAAPAGSSPAESAPVEAERAEGGRERAVGMVTGVEMTHPDKGTEMFLYELGVAPEARRRGVATALVEALAALARERGCYGMWVSTEHDNEAAQRTYRRAGATDEEPFVMLTWDVTR